MPEPAKFRFNCRRGFSGAGSGTGLPPMMVLGSVDRAWECKILAAGFAGFFFGWVPGWLGFPCVHRWTAKDFVLRSFPAHRWIPGPVLTGCTQLSGSVECLEFLSVFHHLCTA